MNMPRLIPAHVVLCFALGFSAAYAVAAEPTVSTYEYKIGDTTYEGYLARPATSAANQPGVLIVHDWMGNSSFTREKAAYLAKLGYIALAVDMYGKGIRATTDDAASKLAGVLYGEPKLFRERILAGLTELKKQPGVDATRLGAIGFCFGGCTALELARSGADVRGVVSFHGSLKPFSATAPDTVKARVLILHGVRDPFVPPPDVAACMTDLNNAHAHFRFVGYSDAVHSFTVPRAGTDPSKGQAYDEAATKAAFTEMEAFFRELFAK